MKRITKKEFKKNNILLMSAYFSHAFQTNCHSIRKKNRIEEERRNEGKKNARKGAKKKGND